MLVQIPVATTNPQFDMKYPFLNIAAVLIAPALSIALSFSLAYGFQRPGGRDSGRSTPTPTPTPKPRGSGSSPVRNTGGGRPVNPAPALAQMTINIPPGCRIWINETPIETSLLQDLVVLIGGQKVKASERSAGVVILKGIKPGTYGLIARKPDFHEYARPVTVTLEGDNVVNVTLTPIPGRLTVAPSVHGAEVAIVSVETNTSVASYTERLDQIELPAGQYRIITSKPGYRVAVREVSLNPGESMYLEPVLELLPRPVPTPTPAPVAGPMNFTVARDGKYLIFHLHGSSGDSSKIVDSVTVTLGGPGQNFIMGNLNGLPCEIELIKLENIAEASIVEAPGPGNNWTSMAVRIRPKDEKRRPITFAINWKSLPNPPAIKLNTQASGFIPAQVIQRVQPELPPAARGSNVSGTVLVLVMIDSEGSVTSAKAVEGPLMFRRVSEDAARKWKFRPATRDGQVIESDQVIQFRFEL
jgi:TonB family protein